MEFQGPLLLVGCGKMGGALLGGWLARGLPAEAITIIEPLGLERGAHAPLGYAGAYPRVLRGPDELESDTRPALVLVAIKPQQMAAAMPDYRRFAAAGSAFLSVAAGTTIATLTEILGAETAILRAMPNTPAAVGMGITVVCANDRASEVQRFAAEELLSAVGVVEWVAEEPLLDAVTAVSGSGPAYVFLLIECLGEAGVAEGLPPALARRLARETVAGAGALIHRSAETAGRLRENVTSPGGTTLAALQILMAEDGLQGLIGRAVAAAARRSRELAS
jgi:pyrroline-5-carboxylate reductase